MSDTVQNTPENAFDYEKELNKTPYISGVTSIPGYADEKYIYLTVPVNVDGQTIGIMYGFVELKKLADSIVVTAFDGKAQIFVADGETGEFLIDTWHDELGNVFDNNMMNRKVKPGYDFLKMKQDFTEGKTGHIAFWSNSAKEYLYSYYTSIGVNKWMVQLSVPESIVFARAIQIRRILYLLIIAETLMYAIYFGLALSNVRRDAQSKKRQLEQSRYMYDVQQTLFVAHKDLSHISLSLQKVAQMLTAESSFLMSTEDTVLKEIFSSSPYDQDWMKYFDNNKLGHFFPYLFSKLSKGQNLLLYSKDLKMIQSEQDQMAFQKGNISNLMMVPVFDSSEKLIGILGGINMKKHWQDTTLLECVVHNFMMALSNISSHRQIERMGIIDALTDLQNRNCYESSLESYSEKYENSLCCLYMDVNGLHELNNTSGHAAGDEMLIYIGSSLKTLFGPKDTYRIGGDEFTVFCIDYSEEMLQNHLSDFQILMDKRDYHISIGKAWLHDCADIKDMITVAEAKMYEAKHQYYKKIGRTS